MVRYGQNEMSKWLFRQALNTEPRCKFKERVTLIRKGVNSTDGLSVNDFLVFLCFLCYMPECILWVKLLSDSKMVGIFAIFFPGTLYC